MSEQTIQVGNRVCCVGRDGAKVTKYCPIWTGKIYEVVVRKSDQALVWALVGSFGGTRSGKKPSEKFIKELQDQAEYPWVANKTHGERVMTQTY